MKPGRSAASGRRLIPLGLLLLAASCGTRPAATTNEAESANREQRSRDHPLASTGTELPGTPMAEREAVLGLLNKRNGITRELKMNPGEALRVGNAIVRLRACETSAPWENVRETGAFVQLDVQESRDNEWHRVFSGWLFKERPDRNVVIHPVYDVWVMSCTMSWPETGPDTVRSADRGSRAAESRDAAEPGAADNASNAPKSAGSAPASSPAPSASPSNSE